MTDDAARDRPDEAAPAPPASEWASPAGQAPAAEPQPWGYAAPAAPTQPWGQPVSAQPWGYAAPGQPAPGQPAPGQQVGGWAPTGFPAAPPPAGAVPTGGAMPGLGQSWAPPPKPGLIPLRPLTLGVILGAMFQVMRRNPLPTFGLALLLTLGSALISAGLIALVVWFTVSRAMTATGDDQQAIISGGLVSGAVTTLVALALNGVVAAVVQGTVSLEVSRATVGERLPMRALWRRLKGSVPRLVGWVLLIGGAAIVGYAVVVGLPILVGTTGGDAGAAGAVALGFLGFGAFGVAAVWLGTQTVFVPAILAIERRKLFDAIRRSRQLIKGSFWKTFGILLLVNAIYGIAVQVIITPVYTIGSLLLGVTLGNTNDVNAIIGGLLAIYGALLVLSFVVGALGVVMITSTTALLYTDLRMRKEGLDLELIRYTEAKAAGDDGVPDPWLPSELRPS